MSNNLPGDTIEGGFTGRVLFIVAEEPRQRIAWPDLSDAQIKTRDSLLEDLDTIAQLRGEIQPTPEAKRAFENWYTTSREPEDIRLRGYDGRKGEHVLKVATCLSISDGPTMTITDRHIEIALAILQKAEQLMPLAFRGAAFSKSSKDIDRVLRHIEKQGGRITHSRLLKKNSPYLNADEFKTVMNTLKEQGDVEEVFEGRARVYRLRST